MVQLAAFIVVIVFIGFILNAFGRWKDTRYYSRKVDQLIAKRDVESDERKREDIQRDIDRNIDLLDRVEKRNISPLQ